MDKTNQPTPQQPTPTECNCYGCRTNSRFGCIAEAHRLGTVDAVIAEMAWEAK